MIRVCRWWPYCLIVSSTRGRQISSWRRTRRGNPKSGDGDRSSEMYDALIYYAGSSRDFAKVRQLLDRRVRDGVVFNRNNTFLFITRHTRDFSTVVDELYQSLSRLHMDVARKISLDSFIDRLCKIGRTDEALRVLDKILAYCDCADALTFHPILQVLTGRRRMGKAWRMVQLMKDYRIAPDVTTYNHLLAAYCRSGEVVEGGRVVARMEEEGVGMDDTTYDSIAVGVRRSGSFERGVLLLRRAADEEEDFTPTATTTTTTSLRLIDAMFRRGQSRVGLELATRMRSGGERPADPKAFAVLARRVLSLGMIEEAELLFGEMIKRRNDDKGLPLEYVS